jgi:hypothetical protein
MVMRLHYHVKSGCPSQRSKNYKGQGMNATTIDATRFRTEGRYFYVWMAVGFLVVAFGGFIPTNWSNIAAGHHSCAWPTAIQLGLLLSDIDDAGRGRAHHGSPQLGTGRHCSVQLRALLGARRTDRDTQGRGCPGNGRRGAPLLRGRPLRLAGDGGVLCRGHREFAPPAPTMDRRRRSSPFHRRWWPICSSSSP